MTSSTLPETPARRRSLAGFSVRNVSVAVGLGVLAALLIKPAFITPLPVLLLRTLGVALLLLGVYVLAGRWAERWHPAWLPRGALQVVAVALAAPLVVVAVSVLAVGGDVVKFVGTPERVLGAIIIAAVSILSGLLISSLAVLRERDALARSQALQFELERSTLERQALDAQLSLLQAQIQPHFLFNTLANVQALVEDGSPRAPAVLKSLISYLRAAMPTLHDAGASTLGNELALVRAYLELMQMRMPDRLQFEIDADPALATRPFPPMALLTLVENAVRHGIDPSEDGGRIEVGARPAAGEALRLWVGDSGVGLSPQAREGTGLSNLRARLHAFYGNAAELQLSEVAPHGLRAELHLPGHKGP
jgi:signal transduction histidine kinase